MSANRTPLQKNRSNLSKRMLLRSMISYALILLIPCFLFASVYERYFEDAYTTRILAQHQSRLERVYADFVSLEDTMRSIAVSLPFWENMHSNEALDSPTYAKVRMTLLGFEIMNPAFEKLDYYTQNMPQFVFTSEGTYTPEYYSRYLLDGEWVQVDRKLATVTQGTWVLPKEVQWNIYSSRRGRLEYIVPTSSKKAYIIFTINPQSLNSYVQDLQDRSILVMAGDRQIYPNAACDPALSAYFAKGTETQNGSIIQYVGSRGGLWVAQRIDQNMLQVDLSGIQRNFIAVLVTVLIVGGLMILFLSHRNYRPISELETCARSKIPDGQMPENVHELETAFFALNALENHNQLIKQKYRTNKILLMLVHGHEPDMNQKDYANLPIISVLSKPYLCVVLIENTLATNSDYVFTTIYEMLNDSNETEGIEYIENKRYLFLIGLYQPQTESLQPVLEAICRETGDGIRIAVSDVCNEPSEICHSFRHASKLLDCSTSAQQRIAYYDQSNSNGNNEMLGLSIDMRVYCQNIREKSKNKLRIFTDVIIDELRMYPNSFAAALQAGALVCNGINTLKETGAERSFTDQIQGLFANSRTLDDLIEILLRISNYSFYQPQTEDVNMLDVCQFIMNNYRNTEINASYLAVKYSIPLSTLSRRFKSIIGVTLSEYITKWQIEYAKELLRETDMTVASIADAMGHTQTSNFIRRFKAYEHMTPNEYRQSLE